MDTWGGATLSQWHWPSQLGMEATITAEVRDFSGLPTAACTCRLPKAPTPLLGVEGLPSPGSGFFHSLAPGLWRIRGRPWVSGLLGRGPFPGGFWVLGTLPAFRLLAASPVGKGLRTPAPPTMTG